jgi:zinc/manganese transport system permease protein
MWAGLALSYAVPRLPPSFAVIATAAAFYLLAALGAQLRPQRER